MIAQAKALVASSPDIRTVLKKSIHDVQGHYIIFCSDTAQLKSLQEKASELFAEVNDITIYSIYSAKKESKQYFEEHGNLKVPRQYVTDTGIKLGMWISDRRRNYQKGMLTEDQVHRLEQIGMIWNVVDNSWEAGLEEATLYYQQFGNLVVNREYITPNNFKLGKWISHMREKYKKDKLTQEQIQQFNEIGMIWDCLLVRTRASKLKTTDIVDPHEVENSQCYVEGATKQVVVNAFERDKTARSKCLKFYKEKDGCIKCQLCGFNFGTFYGEKCNDMIEVHHIKPLSTIREEYSIDPQKDLLPLCPNCHYALHAAFNGDLELFQKHLTGHR